MGPRPDRRGQPRGMVRELNEYTALQWVHGLIAVGNDTNRIGQLPHACASMGPRPDRRGQPDAGQLTPLPGLELQWVHGLIAVGNCSHLRCRTAACTGFNGSTA